MRSRSRLAAVLSCPCSAYVHLSAVADVLCACWPQALDAEYQAEEEDPEALKADLFGDDADEVEEERGEEEDAQPDAEAAPSSPDKADDRKAALMHLAEKKKRELVSQAASTAAAGLLHGWETQGQMQRQNQWSQSCSWPH